MEVDGARRAKARLVTATGIGTTALSGSAFIGLKSIINKLGYRHFDEGP